MKTLIVYFSLEGNTEYAAGKIAAVCGADTLRLVPVKEYKTTGFAKFMWGGKSAVMGETPKLEPYSVDLESYDRIVFGFPIWASRVTPPIRTFVVQNKSVLGGKEICAFACQSGNGAEKALAKLSDLLGKPLLKTAVFIDPKAKQSDETDKAIEEFASSLL